MSLILVHLVAFKTRKPLKSLQHPFWMFFVQFKQVAPCWRSFFFFFVPKTVVMKQIAYWQGWMKPCVQLFQVKINFQYGSFRSLWGQKFKLLGSLNICTRLHWTKWVISWNLQMFQGYIRWNVLCGFGVGLVPFNFSFSNNFTQFWGQVKVEVDMWNFVKLFKVDICQRVMLLCMYLCERMLDFIFYGFWYIWVCSKSVRWCVGVRCSPRGEEINLRMRWRK